MTSEAEAANARRVRLEAQEHAVALASSVAHEVNNPVAFLSLASAELRRMAERPALLDPARLSELAREIEESAARVSRIVHELRLFTRGADPAQAGARGGAAPLGRLVEGALTLASGHMGQRARIEVVRVDAGVQAPVSFGYALLNVFLYIGSSLSRAPVAVDGAGIPLVRVEAVQEADGGLAVTIDVRAGKLPGDLPRLSLDLARDVIEDARGQLEAVDSFVGQMYKLTLPPLSLAADLGSSAGSVRPPRSSPPEEIVRRRVLVIDDESTLARALARGLEERYDVDVACSAADAIGYLQGTRYDAIVCDLHLPERSGAAIQEHVASVSSDQARRFIFTTGAHAVGDEMHRRAVASGCPILEKPFDGRVLEAEVARIAAS